MSWSSVVQATFLYGVTSYCVLAVWVMCPAKDSGFI